MQARFGIPPTKLPFYTAMIGDTSDNIPKLPGIGEATAQRLARMFDDAADLLGRLGDIPEARLRATLESHADQLRKSELLARLRVDVPLAEGPRHAAFTSEVARQLKALCEELECKSLVPRIDALAREG